MANVNIFEKFGLKEVANVYFEALSAEKENGIEIGDIVLFLDTLKVSTIETTAESVDARGGWGNPKLITWDYGKEITLSLEDALLSLESARVMLGGKIKRPAEGQEVEVRYTAEVIAGEGGAISLENLQNPSTKSAYADEDKPASDGGRFINMTQGYRGKFTVNEKQATLTANDGAAEAAAGDVIRLFWSVKKAGKGGNEAVEITISPNTFPGTYRIVGDTFMRSEKDGKDYPFQFIINKAKVMSEVTITLGAEGDPSTFNMTINVLRSGSDEMMKLVRYTEAETTTTEEPDEEPDVQG